MFYMNLGHQSAKRVINDCTIVTAEMLLLTVNYATISEKRLLYFQKVPGLCEEISLVTVS